MALSNLGPVLWACADSMRGSMGADEYKDYLLGLVFYKHISDSQLYDVYDLLKDERPESLADAQEFYEEFISKLKEEETNSHSSIVKERKFFLIAVKVMRLLRNGMICSRS